MTNMSASVTQHPYGKSSQGSKAAVANTTLPRPTANTSSRFKTPEVSGSNLLLQSNTAPRPQTTTQASKTPVSRQSNTKYAGIAAGQVQRNGVKHQPNVPNGGTINKHKPQNGAILNTQKPRNATKTHKPQTKGTRYNTAIATVNGTLHKSPNKYRSPKTADRPLSPGTAAKQRLDDRQTISTLMTSPMQKSRLQQPKQYVNTAAVSSTNRTVSQESAFNAFKTSSSQPANTATLPKNAMTSSSQPVNLSKNVMPSPEQLANNTTLRKNVKTLSRESKSDATLHTNDITSSGQVSNVATLRRSVMTSPGQLANTATLPSNAIKSPARRQVKSSPAHPSKFASIIPVSPGHKQHFHDDMLMTSTPLKQQLQNASLNVLKRQISDSSLTTRAASAAHDHNNNRTLSGKPHTAAAAAAAGGPRTPNSNDAVHAELLSKTAGRSGRGDDGRSAPQVGGRTLRSDTMVRHKAASQTDASTRGKLLQQPIAARRPFRRQLSDSALTAPGNDVTQAARHKSLTPARTRAHARKRTASASTAATASMSPSQRLVASIRHGGGGGGRQRSSTLPRSMSLNYQQARRRLLQSPLTLDVSCWVAAGLIAGLIALRLIKRVFVARS